jgi:pimeloyl-ACP methyl ester carboxylesterase
MTSIKIDPWQHPRPGTRQRHLLLIVLTLLISACQAMPARNSMADATSPPRGCDTKERCRVDRALANADLQQALGWRTQAEHSDRHAAAAWSQCAARASMAMSDPDAGIANDASVLATRCTDGFLALVLHRSTTWSQGPMVAGGAPLQVEFRSLSINAGGPLSLVRAADVPMHGLAEARNQIAGHGIPLATLAPRCNDRADCRLLPGEGIFRWATAWFEMDDPSGSPTPRLVIADPFKAGPLQAGGHRFELAADTSAFIARGIHASKLNRLGIFGLLGGHEVGRRAGVYLLEDYDRTKRPIVMIHGLGSSPLIWAKLSNAIWADPALRDRYQIWHVVYQTNAPLLVARHRVQDYLDDAWRLLDPDGDDPARRGIVLVGHSMGGVVARLLCVDSEHVLWDASFSVPPSQLSGRPDDVAGTREVFLFDHYPGVSRAIFMAAPHRGSPTADAWTGRMMRLLVGRRVPEILALQRIARHDPSSVHDSVRVSYQHAWLNSISTLQTAQPVRRAGETLMPVLGITYHVISGVLPGEPTDTDGVVPLASTLLPEAASTLVVPSGHDVYNKDDAIGEVLRILIDSIDDVGMP